MCTNEFDRPEVVETVNPGENAWRSLVGTRSKEGGLRFGEMEQQAQIAVGAAKFLQERLFLQSDEFKMGLCTRCGNFATTAGYCKSCDDDEVVSLNLPYISKLVFQELQAMLIKTKISIKE